jgi:hypothetical protein
MKPSATVMVRFEEIFCRIQDIARTISNDPVVGARHAPEPWAIPNQCFPNAQRKAQQAGGDVLYGWMFDFREVLVLPGRHYVIAVNHAVWHAPNKTMIDVTPFDPKHLHVKELPSDVRPA